MPEKKKVLKKETCQKVTGSKPNGKSWHNLGNKIMKILDYIPKNKIIFMIPSPINK